MDSNEIRADLSTYPLGETEKDNFIEHAGEVIENRIENNGSLEMYDSIGDLSTNDNVAESNIDCLVRCEFKDNETFEELHSVIGQCIRDTFFSMKKPTKIIIDRNENIVKIVHLPGECANDSMFMVDTLPTDCLNISEVPNYDAMYSDILHESNKLVNNIETNVGSADGKSSGNCFNCLGDHSLKDCKEPHRLENITRNRQQFMQRNKTERYHLDGDQRFGHLVPGTISNDLRDALGLRSRELPLYIYKMRMYGYPPGWLEESKISHSGLALLDTKNEGVLENNLSQAKTIKFDASKFIEYPGFNSPLPSNMIDDSGYYNMPPMQYAHSIKGLSCILQDNLAKSYKRKRLKSNPAQNASENELRNDDMDLASDEDPSASEPIGPLCEQPMGDNPANDDTSNGSTDDSASKSNDGFSKSSLNDLKRKKEELLKALADNTFDQDSNPATDNCHTHARHIEHNDNNATQQNNELNDTIPNDRTIVASTPTTPVANGRSKTTVHGTPLIQQVSPFASLPSSDKWSVGVSDVIDFENLADAVGTYDKMSQIIHKVRVSARTSNQDSEPET